MLENPLNNKLEKRENLILKKKGVENNEEEEEQYIFYNQNKKFTSKIELEVILNSNPSHRVCILVDIKSTLSFLSVKIADYMEHFPTYSNLDGLKAINFSKKTEKGIIPLPLITNGEVKDHFENGNTIYCDLKSEEYWIKTVLNLSSADKKLSISLDIKTKVEMVLVKFKLLIVKMALNIWIDFCKNDFLHYIFIGAKLEIKNSKRNLNIDITDLTKKSSYDDMRILEIFDFNSEICCNFKLTSIENLIFNQLIKYKPSEFEDRNKFENLIHINFTDFMKLSRYEDEQTTIRSLIKKYLSNPVFCVKGSIYCYRKTHKGKSPKNLNLYEGLASDIIIMPSKKVLKGTSLLEGSDVGSFSEPNVFLKDDHITTHVGFNSFISNSKDNFGFEFKGNNDNPENRKENIVEEEKFTEMERANMKISKRFSQDNIGKTIFENLPFKSFIKTIQKEKCDENFVDVKDECKEETKDSNIKINTSFIHKAIKKSNSKKDLSYSKISIITNKNPSLSPDIIRLITLDKFNHLIESNSIVRVSKMALEKITMPQFRSMKMNKGDNTDLTNITGKTDKENVASVYNNKRALIIIGVLIIVLIFVIILCICM